LEPGGDMKICGVGDEDFQHAGFKHVFEHPRLLLLSDIRIPFLCF
jgi:hypothetical protein